MRSAVTLASIRRSFRIDPFVQRTGVVLQRENETILGVALVTFALTIVAVAMSIEPPAPTVDYMWLGIGIADPRGTQVFFCGPLNTVVSLDRVAFGMQNLGIGYVPGGARIDAIVTDTRNRYERHLAIPESPNLFLWLHDDGTVMWYRIPPGSSRKLFVMIDHVRKTGDEPYDLINLVDRWRIDVRAIRIPPPPPVRPKPSE